MISACKECVVVSVMIVSGLRRSALCPGLPIHTERRSWGHTARCGRAWPLETLAQGLSRGGACIPGGLRLLGGQSQEAALAESP